VAFLRRQRENVAVVVERSVEVCGCGCAIVRKGGGRERWRLSELNE